MNACCGFHASGQCNGGFAIGTAVPTGGATRVPFFDGATPPLLDDSADFTYDDGSKVLTVTARVAAGELRATSAGNAGNPTIHWGTDPDTGLFNKAANQIGVACAGAEVAFWASTGLSVLADTDAATTLGRLRIDARVTDRMYLSHVDCTGTADQALFQTAVGDTFVNAKAGQTLTLSVNNGNRMRANNTGIAFFSAAPVGAQTSGANLTNNVTAGGTDDTIANFTDLSVYANDAAAIRNDIYQLARKLKQINDGLRTYGLFT